MSDHAFLPPSGADCWVACHKWPWMQREFPDLGDKTAADEGTLAAQALNCLATGQPMPAGVTDEMAVSHYFKRLTMIENTFGDTDYHLRRVTDAGGLV